MSYAVVSLLEDGAAKVFPIWTGAAADLAAMQPDIARWPVPSLERVQGTVLGQRDFAGYFGPGGKDIPEQGRATMQERFGAVSYAGPLAEVTLAKRPRLAERFKKECAG